MESTAQELWKPPLPLICFPLAATGATSSKISEMLSEDTNWVSPSGWIRGRGPSQIAPSDCFQGAPESPLSQTAHTLSESHWNTARPERYQLRQPSIQQEFAWCPRKLTPHLITEAIARMIIDHADGLHESVTNGRADESETARLQILAQRIRFRGARRNLPRSRPIISLRTSAHELPHVTVERSEFALHRQICRGVGNRSRNLQAIAHNPSVPQKRPYLARIVSRNLLGIESIERAPVILALVENRLPAQSRLRAFQYQKLEKQTVVVHWLAPLPIVVLHHQRLLRPMAPPLLFFHFHTHRRCCGRMLRPVVSEPVRDARRADVGADAVAAERHRRHKQSA